MKNETFDKILDSLIDEAIPTVEAMPDKNLPEEKEVAFSEEFETRMGKFFDNERKKRRRKAIARRTKYIAASIAIVFAVSGAAVMSVDAFRVRVFNFVVERRKTNAKITVNEGVQLNSYETDEISLEYIPEGFQLHNDESTENMIFLNFENKDQLFSVSVVSLNAVMTVDTENADVENMTINGMEALYIENEKMKMVVMHDDEKIYTVEGENIEKAELLNIAQNLKINKDK